MRCISEAKFCIMGNTSDTFPPWERIEAAKRDTAISCCPKA